MLAKVLGFLTAGAQPAQGALVEAELPELTAQHFQAMVDAAREELRDAHRTRDLAAGALREAEERKRKALEVIQDAQRADTASEEAERTACAAAQAWATAGSPPDARPDPALLKRAGDAFNAAIDARVIADGARAALPALMEAEREAHSKLSSADDQVRWSARRVMVALIEPHFGRLERAARAWEEASIEVQGLAKSLAGKFGQAVQGGESSLLKRLHALVPQRPRADYRELILNGAGLDSQRWVDFGKRLVEDPEATL
ncbi:MAG TPA: hypothetical protein VFA39_04340 [Steroidobacteraceae bacterium]|nr:hypothetical protein [Steroidobacteraceae bacterium]